MPSLSGLPFFCKIGLAYEFTNGIVPSLSALGLQPAPGSKSLQISLPIRCQSKPLGQIDLSQGSHHDAHMTRHLQPYKAGLLVYKKSINVATNRCDISTLGMTINLLSASKWKVFPQPSLVIVTPCPSLRRCVLLVSQGVTNAGCRFDSPCCGFAPALEDHERSVLVAVSPRGRGERSRPLAVQAFGCECFASRPPSVYLPRSSSKIIHIAASLAVAMANLLGSVPFDSPSP